ncbi:FtsK/SpoIIIE domain-containing protein [Brachybacterium sp. AOP42-C2-15]|uniref:FtsK/SpoIIIE domain-containing protein n=1 Tax=Brachybacterium sp. AOP42-C2-15 TaxID=3457670 RepID=UPI0040337774
MAQKYDKPALNLTLPLTVLTILFTGAAVLVGLPAGWVLFTGMLAVACLHPAPMLTGPKETPANPREERLVRRHRSWLDTRTSLLLGNAWGWETVWPGIPTRLSFIASAATGALVAALPLSGQLPTVMLERLGALLGADAPVVAMPWWVAVTSGLLTHHVVTSLLARRRRVREQPVVAIVPMMLRQLWSSRARPLVLAAPLVAVFGVWAAATGLAMAGQNSPTWRAVGMAAATVLAIVAILGGPISRICLERWRRLQEANEQWAPRFAELFTEKEGRPRIVDRTVALCGAIVDMMDAPPKLMAAGLQERADAISAFYGDPSTRIDVLSSPNLDAAGQQIPGTAHQLRVRIVQWPEGSFPNLLDPDLDPYSRDLALESVLARALDGIGVNRMALLEAVLVAHLPTKADPRQAELTEKRNRSVRQQIEKLGDKDPAEVARLEQSLAEPVELPRSSRFAAAWRWLRGVPAPAPVTPEDSPLAIWKTTWAMPGIPTPPWHTIQSEYATIAAACSTVVEGESVDVDVVVDRRNSYLLVGDPLSEDARYAEDSGLTVEQVRNVQAEIEWEKRWEQTLPQGAQPPTTRFEITRDAELTQRFSRDGLVLHEQLFATKTGLDAGETYIDPRGKDFEKGMRTSITGAQMVSIVGWPSEREGPGSRHPHLFLVRWATDPVPTTPQDVAPPQGAAPVATSASAWMLAHLINSAFRAAAVKMPKPELVETEALTMPASSKHAWKVTLRLHGGTTLVDVRKKADAIRSQLACPWMRLASPRDGEVTLYIGDPGPGAKLRCGAEVEVRRVDFDQAFVDSNITNLSGSVPTLTKLETLASNDQVEVLDFDLPAGVDVAKVNGNREKLRSNLNVEFLDVRRHGASGIQLFMAEHDPLPERVGIPFDRLGDTPAAFGVSALGEPTIYDPIENPHLLVLGGTGAGKSAAISTILFDLIRCGYLPVVIDPTKGGYDFLFAKDWAIAPFAADVYQAASTMKALYGELERRKALNGTFGVVNIDKLPEEASPPHLIVVVDEFTSLIGKSSVPPKSDDPAADHARLEAEAENNARAIIGNIVGKLGREARSVGIHLLLGTQKLSSKILDTMPGGADIKTNLARMGLGNMTQGDRMSAFRNPMEADTIAAPRVGRGLFEPLTAPHPRLMQVWYEENATLHEKLQEHDIPRPVPAQLLDPLDPRYVVAPLADFVDVVEETITEQAVPAVEELDLNISFDLGSLLGNTGRDSDPERGASSGGRSVALSELAANSHFELLEALQTVIEQESVTEIVVDVEGLDTESEVGATYRELITELAADVRAELHEPATPARDAQTEGPPEVAPDPVDAPETPPAPVADTPDDEDDGFDFTFEAPPMVRGGI